MLAGCGAVGLVILQIRRTPTLKTAPSRVEQVEQFESEDPARVEIRVNPVVKEMIFKILNVTEL